MKSNKPNKQKTQNLQTLCTLDTEDIIITADTRQLFREARKSKEVKRKKSTVKNSDRQNNTLNKTNSLNTRENAYNQKTPKSSTKIQRSKSRQGRVRTEYAQKQTDSKCLIKNLEIFTTLKKVKFQMDQKYNIDPFYVIKTIKENSEQIIQEVRYLDSSIKGKDHYILKKSNSSKMQQKYLKQIEIKQHLTDKLKAIDKKNLSCIYKHYHDKKKNLVLVYFMQGQQLTWKKNLHKKLFQNLNKNKHEILKHIIKQIAKAIHVLSKQGICHSQIKLKNILLDIQQDQENVKVSKHLKVGGLHKCFKFSDRKNLLKMSRSYYTPPQVTNYMLFENQRQNFDRKMLQYLYRYQEAWRVDVWALGILALNLINRSPLEQLSEINLRQIFQGQKNIQIKFQFVFSQIQDEQFEKSLKKMLSLNPFNRPNPQQIISILSQQ